MAAPAVSPLLRSLRNLNKYDPVQVNHMREVCIAVNEQDQVVGEVSKVDAHVLPGMSLHRAFSVFAFTPEKRLILQKRSCEKITFPNLWTNTCCSHPLYNPHEMDGSLGVQRAATRKLHHELNIKDISPERCLVLGRFLYKATMTDSPWGEHELDYGVVIRDIRLSSVRPNPEEVSEICAVSENELADWIKQDPQAFSPWFSLFVKESHLSSWWKNLDNLQTVKQSHIIRLN